MKTQNKFQAVRAGGHRRAATMRNEPPQRGDSHHLKKYFAHLQAARAHIRAARMEEFPRTASVNETDQTLLEIKFAIECLINAAKPKPRHD